MIRIGQTSKGHPIPNKYYIVQDGEYPGIGTYLSKNGGWETHCLNGYFDTQEDAETALILISDNAFNLEGAL